MKVHIAQHEERGPLFEGDALMVFFHAADAQREVERMDEPAFAAEIEAEYVAERLRKTGRDSIVFVLSGEASEKYATTVEGLEHLAAHMDDVGEEELIEEAKTTLTNRFLIDLLDSGLVEYDAETDTLRRRESDE